MIDGPLPPSIDEVYEEGIAVCALLEIPDRYRFHSLRRQGLELSDAKASCAVAQTIARVEISFIRALPVCPSLLMLT